MPPFSSQLEALGATLCRPYWLATSRGAVGDDAFRPQWLETLGQDGRVSLELCLSTSPSPYTRALHIHTHSPAAAAPDRILARRPRAWRRTITSFSRPRLGDWRGSQGADASRWAPGRAGCRADAEQTQSRRRDAEQTQTPTHALLRRG